MSRTVGSVLSRDLKEIHSGQQEFAFVRAAVKGKNIFLNLKEIKVVCPWYTEIKAVCPVFQTRNKEIWWYESYSWDTGTERLQALRERQAGKEGGEGGEGCLLC